MRNPIDPSLSVESSKKFNKTGPFFRFDPYASTLGVVVVFIASQLLAALVIGLYPVLVNMSDSEAATWSSTAVAQFMFICVIEALSIIMILRLLRLAGRRPSQIGIVRPVFFDLIRGLIGWLVYFILFLIIMSVVTGLTGVSTDQEQNIGFKYASTSIELVMAFLALVVIVPVAEEIMFRGFLFSSLRSKYGYALSAAIASVLFGAAHLYNGAGSPLLWAVAIDTLILSLIMCFLRERTGSIWPPVVVHMLKNGLAFIILFASPLLNLVY